MRKRDRIIFISGMFTVIIIVIFIMFLTGVVTLPKAESSKEQNIGEITKTADDYDPSIEYIQQFDEVVEDDYFVVINNIDLILNNITLQAANDLDRELSNFLVTQGYSSDDLVTLTIDESTIVNDRSYPFFEMKIDGTTKTVRAYYELEEYTWKFSMK